MTGSYQAMMGAAAVSGPSIQPPAGFYPNANAVIDMVNISSGLSGFDVSYSPTPTPAQPRIPGTPTNNGYLTQFYRDGNANYWYLIYGGAGSVVTAPFYILRWYQTDGPFLNAQVLNSSLINAGSTNPPSPYWRWAATGLAAPVVGKKYFLEFFKDYVTTMTAGTLSAGNIGYRRSPAVGSIGTDHTYRDGGQLQHIFSSSASASIILGIRFPLGTPDPGRAWLCGLTSTIAGIGTHYCHGSSFDGYSYTNAGSYMLAEWEFLESSAFSGTSTLTIF